MLGPSEFRRLISGRRRGPGAAILRAALRAAELPYTAAVKLRNWRYDRKLAATHRVEVPVISVGNITLGGTGKTPAVEWFARWFEQRGVHVAIVSRGYGAEAGKPNDEALELAQKLPNVPHVLDPDRVRGAKRAIAQFGSQLLLLDDGFQHRRLARDFDVVLIDALEPYGFEHVFPRGTLREPLAGWSRADAFMLTRSEQIDEAARDEIRRQALARSPQAIWLEATYKPHALRAHDGAKHPLYALAGEPVAAFCGIGNPESFRRAMEASKFDLLALREFPDHHAYPEADIKALARWADAMGVAGLICTHKDLVKVGENWPGKTPLLALSSHLEILVGQEELEKSLQPFVRHALGQPIC